MLFAVSSSQFTADKELLHYSGQNCSWNIFLSIQKKKNCFFFFKINKSTLSILKNILLHKFTDFTLFFFFKNKCECFIIHCGLHFHFLSFSTKYLHEIKNKIYRKFYFFKQCLIRFNLEIVILCLPYKKDTII